MRIALRLALGCLMAASISTTTLALTVNFPVTSAYLQDHSNEFRVKVSKGKNGLIDFTVVRTLSKPMYLVAHLAVHQQGRVIAESHSPSFTKNHENTFYFSLSPEDVGESTFELGESFFTEFQGQAVPVVGTTNYQFQLKDFVPEDLIKSTASQVDRPKIDIQF
jgi:hypothetical protein